jgi:hypothetical protein
MLDFAYKLKKQIIVFILLHSSIYVNLETADNSIADEPKLQISLMVSVIKLSTEKCRYCKLRSPTIEIPRQYPA